MDFIKRDIEGTPILFWNVPRSNAADAL